MSAFLRSSRPFVLALLPAWGGIAGQPDTYFMGTTGGGVWKTTNVGQDWQNLSDGKFDMSSIGGIDVANSDPKVLYVGTGSACMRGNIQTGRGVYKSTDGDNSWSFVGLPEAGLIGKVAVHPKDADVAYVAAVGHDGLTAQAASISEKLTSIEEELMQMKNESHQAPLNFPPQLDNQYAYLYGFVAGPDGPPTESAHTRFEDANEQWRKYRTPLQTILDTDVSEFNEQVRALESDPVFVPVST